jgi:tight adherence protein C
MMSESLGFVGALVAAAPSVATSPFALALLAALGVLTAIAGILQVQTPGLVAQRLGSFGPAPRSLEDLELQLSFRERVLMPLARRLSSLVVRYTPTSTIEQYRRKLILAGSPGRLDVRDFLGLKGLLALGPAAGYMLLGSAFRVGPSPILIALLLAIIGFYAPNIYISRRIKRRQNEIQRAVPDTLDLLTICVEAGLGFDAAISRVVEKRNDELSREFGRVLSEMRVGRSRRDALRTLGDRTDVPDVNTFVGAILQSEQLGVSISRVLLTQAEQMRIKRRQRAEEAAQKAPLKMLFPMALLIFPAIFIVVLGPAVPKILDTLGGL